jgi:lipopolysaccharide transport system ATP-binding protein
MSDYAIRVENVWKEYALHVKQDRTNTIYESLSNGLTRPFKKIRGEIATPADNTRFWALKEVSFDIKPGEVVGVIGRNGAGKSTLLKILSRITAPTKGRIEVRGRLASLLEVGTGFHPELSGRENIYLNGAILGMTSRDIHTKFDEIVAFAEVEKFVDTPVKRYSSGMYVRLAFAVAAHLEADVLLVDEVLAVGDLAFQQKSMGKMGEVAGRGKTVVFVSHSLASIRSLCRQSILLSSGSVSFIGGVSSCIERYENSLLHARTANHKQHFSGPLAPDVEIDSVSWSQVGAESTFADVSKPLCIVVNWRSSKNYDTFDLKISLYRDGLLVTSCHDAENHCVAKSILYRSVFELPPNAFNPGRYMLGLGVKASQGGWMWGADVFPIDFSENSTVSAQIASEGLVRIPYSVRRGVERNPQITTKTKHAKHDH